MNHSKLTSLATISLLGAAMLGVSACAGKNDSSAGSDQLSTDQNALVSDGTAGAQAGDTSASMATIPVLGLTTSAQIADPGVAATAAAAPEWRASYFKPAGCVSADRVGNVVTYTFNACTGPFGLVAINGKIIATYSAGAGGGLDVSTTSQGLTVAGEAATQTGSGHLAWAGTSRTFNWKGEWKGTTPKGYPIDHHGEHNVSWDTATECVERDGSGSTTVSAPGGDRTHSHTLSGYKRCAGYCPQSGTLVLTGAKGLSMTLKFLGAASLEVTGPKGGVIDVPLECTPQK